MIPPAKKYAAELIGTYLLVFIGCSAVIAAQSFRAQGAANFGPAGIVAVGLTFGLALCAIVAAFGPISGAHVNPAVTAGFIAARKIDLKEGLLYMVAQFAGAILAAVCLLKVYDVGYGLGGNLPGSWGEGSAWMFEIVSTFLFFLVIYGTAAGPRATPLAPLAIGGYLAASHFAGIPVSGSSLNPARSFGPALVENGVAIHHVAIYLVGPSVGAIGAGLLCGWLHEDRPEGKK